MKKDIEEFNEENTRRRIWMDENNLGNSLSEELPQGASSQPFGTATVIYDKDILAGMAASPSGEMVRMVTFIS